MVNQRLAAVGKAKTSRGVKYKVFEMDGKSPKIGMTTFKTCICKESGKREG